MSFENKILVMKGLRCNLLSKISIIYGRHFCDGSYMIDWLALDGVETRLDADGAKVAGRSLTYAIKQ